MCRGDQYVFSLLGRCARFTRIERIILPTVRDCVYDIEEEHRILSTRECNLCQIGLLAMYDAEFFLFFARLCVSVCAKISLALF